MSLGTPQLLLRCIYRMSAAEKAYTTDEGLFTQGVVPVAVGVPVQAYRKLGWAAK